jgi:uncharacterized protein (TIGR02145 family)
MKTIWTIFLGLFLTVNFTTAQDTLYVYKGGAVLYKRVISAVDSLTFQKVYAPPSTVTDKDGNVYQTVTIGTQTWMASNLRVTHYRNGESITNLTVDAEWAGATFAAWCDYSNSADNGTKYGHLYNWYAASDSRNIAPVGWHVPTDAEWTTLTTYLGGESVAGGKLKEAGTLNWATPNTGTTNETGFSALPGGDRDSFLGGTFSNLGRGGYWWSSTENGTTGALDRLMVCYDSNVTRLNSNKAYGYSVRCVRDY